jgi:hypothetical protein
MQADADRRPLCYLYSYAEKSGGLAMTRARLLMLMAVLAAATVAQAGTKTIITQTPDGEILEVEKV